MHDMVGYRANFVRSYGSHLHKTRLRTDRAAVLWHNGSEDKTRVRARSRGGSVTSTASDVPCLNDGVENHYCAPN